MRLLGTVLVVLLAGHAGPGMAQEQSGRFPVFGPSAEREAFFQGQRDAEAARVERLEEQRREAALARELARQEAETARALARAAEAAEPKSRGLVRRCYLTRPAPDVPAVTDDEGPFTLGVLPTRQPGQIRCPYYAFVPRSPYGSSVAITVDDGDVSGRVRILGPGLNIDLSAD